VSARRRISSMRRLARNQIVDGAAKIIGEGRVRRVDVEAIVDQMGKMCERSKRNRLRESKNQKQFAKQYGAALRKVISMTRRTSTDFRALPMQVSAPQLGIDRELFDHEHLLRHLKLLNAICESWEKSKLGKPKPNADEKRLAAEAALHLLKMHDIEPTATKIGAFCQLAAVLYGDKSADLQHHCRAALRTAERRLAGRKSGLNIMPVMRLEVGK
jgi:hypothetical protein